ncbi:MAG: fibrobacter succinogenes major paralogous domain-containing protein [Bacteroidales bacterium]|nr:fibrobacter succinogenes major paralogous domain-containing protein [Bacteroidales bacterium]
MKFRTVITAVALLALAAAACKKEESTKSYLSGTLKVDTDMPVYVQPGSKYGFTPSGITAPDGTDVAYYFQSPITNYKDTVRSETHPETTFIYEVPDTIGTFSMSCVAYPVQSSDKYYVSSTSTEFVIVKEGFGKGLTITGYRRYLEDEVRTLWGREYYLMKSGSTEWIRWNLCHIVNDDEGEPVFGRPYYDSPAMQNIFGAFYTWTEAQEACPPGWHLPSDAEWVELLKENGAPADLGPLQDSPSGAGKLMVNASFNEGRMWEYYRDVKISDASHFSAMPVGYALIRNDGYNFTGYGSYAVFWTSDEHEGKGVYRYLYKEKDWVYSGFADKDTFAASVRCVR